VAEGLHNHITKLNRHAKATTLLLILLGVVVAEGLHSHKARSVGLACPKP